MSGKYASKVGLQHFVTLSNQASGLPLEEVTLPDLLRSLGYRTHMVGKWHLGYHKWEYTPVHRGFDSFLGYHLGASTYFNHSWNTWRSPEDGTQVQCPWGYDLWINEDNVGEELSGIYSMELYAQEIEKVIKSPLPSDKEKPMFLYAALQAPHSPLTPLQSDLENNPQFEAIDPVRYNYAALVSSLDRTVGRIVEALKEADMWDNTVLVFSSDNGGEIGNGGFNWPLRGEKATLWEGGTKAVSFIHAGSLWPFQNAAEAYDGLLHITDWLPTLFSLAGGQAYKLPKDLDGYNVWEAISNGRASPRDTVLYNVDEAIRCGAVRQGVWKLLVDGSCGNPKRSAWFTPPEVQIDFSRNSSDSEGIWLVNLEDDPLETNNLAKENPEMVEKLSAILRNYALLAAPSQNYINPGEPAANPQLHEGKWVPWQEEEYQN